MRRLRKGPALGCFGCEGVSMKKNAYAHRELYGVGGWLALLIVGLTVLGPIARVVRVIADFGQAESANPALLNEAWWSALKAIGWVETVIYCAASFFAGSTLLRVFQPSSVRLAINTLWLAGPLLVLVSLSASKILLPVSLTSAEFIIALVQPIIVATVWTLYLKKSQRVENTYFPGAK
jgi:Protein of unknown function (DUF2569)